MGTIFSVAGWVDFYIFGAGVAGVVSGLFPAGCVRVDLICPNCFFRCKNISNKTSIMHIAMPALFMD